MAFRRSKASAPNELRRMIYAHKIRRERVPVFGDFDCPDAGQSMPRRSESTTAVQALSLFNSDFVADRAKAFADRVKQSSPTNVEEQVTKAFALAYRSTVPNRRSWRRPSRWFASMGWPRCVAFCSIAASFCSFRRSCA